MKAIAGNSHVCECERQRRKHLEHLVSAGVVDDELVAATVELVGSADVVLVESSDVVLELVGAPDDELEVITMVVGAGVVL